MLILTRTKNQKIIVCLGPDTKPGDIIEVAVAEVRGGKVRIGVNASKLTSVDREEIWNAKKAQAIAEAGQSCNPGPVYPQSPSKNA